MKRIKVVAFLSALTLSFGAFLSPALAAPWDESSSATQPGVDCFQYYKFESVKLNLLADRQFYNPGDPIVFKGSITNQNNYPIFDGYLFARVTRLNKDYQNGNDVVDEFFAAEKVALAASSTKAISASWQVPQNLPKGEYKALFYFSTGKRFNLTGLPFSNEIVGEAASFSVVSDNASSIAFDRKNTKVNNEVYRHIGDWPTLSSKEKIVVTQPILNNYKEAKKVDITYDLFYWDSLNEKDKISTKTEQVDISAGASKVLTYTIDTPNQAVYYLRITATSGTEKAIVNIRFTTDLNKPKLNFPAITKFPLTSGDKFSAFACFNDVNNSNQPSKVLVTLIDKDQNEVGRVQFDGPIGAEMMADAKELVAQKDYDYLKLKAQILNKDGKVVDEYETEYDCNLNNTCLPKPILEKSSNNQIIFFGVGAVLLIVVILILLKRRQGANIPTAMMVVLVFSGLLYSVLFYSKPGVAKAAIAVTSNSNTEKGFQTDTDYFHSWWGRRVVRGNIKALYKVVASQDPTRLTQGSSVTFTFNPYSSTDPTGRPEFTTYDGGWDTPFARWTDESGDDGDIETNPTYMTRSYIKNSANSYFVHNINSGDGWATFVCNKPTVTYSSPASFLTCSGGTCSVNASFDPSLGDKNTTISATVGSTTCRVYSFIAEGDTTNPGLPPNGDCGVQRVYKDISPSAGRGSGTLCPAWASRGGSTPGCCLPADWDGKNETDAGVGVYTWAADDGFGDHLNCDNSCNCSPSTKVMFNSYCKADNTGCLLEGKNFQGLTCAQTRPHDASALSATAYRATPDRTYKIDIPGNTVDFNVTVKGNGPDCGTPTTVGKGEVFSGSIKVQNSGPSIWDSSFDLRPDTYPTPPTSTPTPAWGVGKMPVSGTVAIGSAHIFNNTFTAPQTTGSLPFNWRMVKGGATYNWLNDVSYCPPINVVNCMPLTLVNASTEPVKVLPSGNYHINCDFGEQVDSINAMPGSGSCSFLSWGDPGSSGFSPQSDTTAVFNCTAGNAISNFGNSCKVVAGTGSANCADTKSAGTLQVSQPSDNASSTACEIKTEVVAGQTFGVLTTMENSGETDWVNPNYKLGVKSSSWGATTEFPVDQTITPGNIHSFDFELTAPSTPGDYPLNFQMKGPSGWFGEINSKCDTLNNVHVKPVGFKLEAKGDLIVDLDKSDLGINGSRNSTSIKVNVTPLQGFAGSYVDFNLVSSPFTGKFVSPDAGHPNRLLSSQFGGGIKLSLINIPNTTATSTRKITIRGVSNDGVEVTTDATLRIISSGYQNN